MQHLGQLILPGQGKVDHDNFPFQFGRQAQPATDQDQSFVPGLCGLQHFLELPDQDRIGISSQKGVEIVQHGDGFVREFGECQQHGHGIVAVPDGSGGDVQQSRRDAPDVKTETEFLGNALKFGFDPLFFGRDQVEAGIPGP